MSDWQVDIGLETHVQLKTKSKLFCACDNNAREADPNTLICPICLGMPGTLPMLNEGAIELALRLGLALNAETPAETKFDRKNYFYPDLPKGYQITQFDQPIVGKGHVEVPLAGKAFNVGIVRAHMEEDAGKLIHEGEHSLVDLNRAGTPLMEIVSEPDIHSPAEAKAYAQELYNIVRYADISDANLYYGNMRFDVNVSIRKKGSELGTRTETKNLNSFRAVEKAAEYEIKRQTEVLEKGGKVVQETRGWDDAKGKTISQRGKEEAHDYRYFPEPDLPPLVITAEMKAKAKKDIPKLPAQIRGLLIESGIDAVTATTLLDNPSDIDLLLGLSSQAKSESLPGVAKYLTGKVRAYRNEHPDTEIIISGADLLELYQMQSKGTVGSSAADEILLALIAGKGGPEKIAKDKKLLQVSDSGEIEKIVDHVLTANQPAVEDYQKGNENSLQFLVGQVMKESKGQANPQLARDMLEKKVSKS